MKRTLAVLFTAAAVACTSSASPVPRTEPRAQSSDRGASTQPSKAGKDKTMVEVTADQARANSLPPITVRLDTSGTPMEATPFPEAGKYLIVSGPPGGVLELDVWATDEAGTDAAAVERAVKAKFSQPWDQPLVIGAPGSMNVVGSRRAATSFFTGDGMNRTAWCGAIVQTKAGNALVTLGVAAGNAGAVTCDQIVAHPLLGKLVSTLSISA